jgi:hypothetical protein
VESHRPEAGNAHPERVLSCAQDDVVSVTSVREPSLRPWDSFGVRRGNAETMSPRSDGDPRRSGGCGGLMWLVRALRVIG